MAGMFCALCAATLWQGFATKFSLPVSTTHSIVGGVLGFAIVSRGYGAPDWEKIGMIVASWLLSPVLSCCVAGVIHMALMKPLVLDRPDPFAAAAKARRDERAVVFC
jgi:PiT family inorganic phosphate transporter